MDRVCWVYKVHHIGGTVFCLKSMHGKLIDPSNVSWNSVQFEVWSIFLYEDVEQPVNWKKVIKTC